MKPRALFAMPELEDSDNVVGDITVDSVITGVEHSTVEDQQEGLTNWIRPDMEGLCGDAGVIEKAVPMAELDNDDLPDDLDENDEYIGDGVVAPVLETEEDDDIFFV
ncbi:unnamed protein product [Urochloa humidicola]